MGKRRPKSEVPDAELSFEDLERKWTPLMHKLAARCSIAERDDVLQELRLRLWRAKLGFDPTRGAKFGTYLYVALQNTIWKQLWKHRHRLADSLDERRGTGFDVGVADSNLLTAELLCQASSETRRIANKVVDGATWKDVALDETSSAIKSAQHELSQLLRDDARKE